VFALFFSPNGHKISLWMWPTLQYRRTSDGMYRRVTNVLPMKIWRFMSISPACIL